MNKISDTQSALNNIESEAAYDALKWLQKEKPKTADAIECLVLAGWSEAKIADVLARHYQDTEQRAQHKMRLVVKKLISQREND